MKSSAQELFVFSEVPLLAATSAKTISCDSIDRWRDVAPLSPAVEQGSRFVLILAVADLPGKPFVLDTGQYPAGLFPLRMHRLEPWVDDVQSPVTVPVKFEGRIPEGQRCALFLLEADVPKTAPLRRMKLEPAVWFPNPGGENFWIRYPMEVRVVAARPERAFQTIQCPAASSKIESIVLGGIPGLLGACVEDADREKLPARVREMRRNLGKNQ